MSRPAVKLENHEAVYAWYGEHGQRPGFATFGHWLVAQVHQPRITAEVQAGDVVRSLLSTHTRLVLVANHTDARDVTVLPAAVWDYKPLRPVVGDARIIAKQEMFTGEFLPKSLKPIVRRGAGLAMRYTGDALGMIPAFRAMSNQQASQEQLLEANVNLAETVGSLMVRGAHVALFGEGTWNLDDPTTVMPIKPGVKHMIEAVHPAVKTAVVTMGIWHPEQGSPRVHMGSPIMAPHSLGDLQGEIRGHLQHCVDIARTVEAA